MTRDEIIRMAREAGGYEKHEVLYFTIDDLERFFRAAYVAGDAAGAADEREACAIIDWTPILRNKGMVTWGDAETLADLVSAAIRARRQE